ncbi:hypothetical protein ES319_A05G176800v1, partial [Gossypium barbadense]
KEQIDLVGKAFVDHYYHLFDNDRPALSSLYKPSSTLTFEGHKIQGVEDITAKLISLPFDQCQRVISTIDSQPSFSGGIVVFISGSLQLSGEEHHLRFSQMFHLIPMLEGNFYVQNDIFRLNYG